MLNICRMYWDVDLLIIAWHVDFMCIFFLVEFCINIEINLLYNLLNFFVIFNARAISSVDHFEHIMKLIILIGEYLYLDLITYKLGIWVAGSWKFLDSTNGSSRFPDLRKSTGNSMIELVSTPTKITGVHYVQVSRWNCW